jgi:hypothetical protein
MTKQFIYIGSEKFSSDEFEFRYLAESDYNRGVFEVLSQLTKAPKPSFEDFKNFLIRQNEANAKHINIIGV